MPHGERDPTVVTAGNGGGEPREPSAEDRRVPRKHRDRVLPPFHAVRLPKPALFEGVGPPPGRRGARSATIRAIGYVSRCSRKPMHQQVTTGSDPESVILMRNHRLVIVGTNWSSTPAPVLW